MQQTIIFQHKDDTEYFTANVQVERKTGSSQAKLAKILEGSEANPNSV